MKERRHDLKILGDSLLTIFGITGLNYCSARNTMMIMSIVIREFYKFAGIEMPEWLTRWITETALEELDVDEAAIIRSILFDHIHDKLRTNAHLLAMKNDGGVHIETRIAACLDNNLLSFIKKSKSDNGIDVYHIDSSILMLLENRLPYI